MRVDPLAKETKAHYLTFHVSDSWNLTSYLNLMAGLRYEAETLIGELSEFTWDGNWAPRAHLTLDPTRDNKSKLSFAYGRFFGKVPNDLAVRAMSSEVTYILNYPLTSVDLTDPNNPRITGPPLQDPFITGGATRFDPDAKLTYQDEYVASAEREVMPFLNVAVSYTHRSLGRTLEDVQLASYSGILNGTESFGESFITNPKPELGFPQPSRNYNAVTLMADKRFHDRWQLLGSYTWSRLEGNYEGYFRRDNGQADPYYTSLFDFPYLKDPEIFKHLIEDGVLLNDRTHVFNIQFARLVRLRFRTQRRNESASAERYPSHQARLQRCLCEPERDSTGKARRQRPDPDDDRRRAAPRVPADLRRQPDRSHLRRLQSVQSAARTGL